MIIAVVSMIMRELHGHQIKGPSLELLINMNFKCTKSLSFTLHRNAVRLCLRAHTCFPESQVFASLSTPTPDTLMNTMAQIFKGSIPSSSADAFLILIINGRWLDVKFHWGQKCFNLSVKVKYTSSFLCSNVKNAVQWGQNVSKSTQHSILIRLLSS